MENEEKIILLRKEMSREQIDIVYGLMKVINDHSVGSTPIPMYLCSDGTKFDKEYDHQAFNHQRILWIRQNLIAKYKQITAESHWWNMLSITVDGNGAFNGCYWLNVNEPTQQAIDEIYFMHPFLSRDAIHSAIINNGPGWYLISYGEIDRYGLHKLETTQVNITPAKTIGSKLARLQLELKDMIENA